MNTLFFKVANFTKGLFKACIVPRPIGWITTIDIKGNENLAPFSYFNAISDDPPMIMFSTTGKHIGGGVKDTLRNVEETREFVINIATEELRTQVNLTSADLAKGKSEFEYAELERIPSVLVKPPRVKRSPIHLECTYYSSIQLPCNSENNINRMVLGKVEGIHIAENVLTDGLIDWEKLRPIARMGYNDYATITRGNIFSLSRPAHELFIKKEEEKWKKGEGNEGSTYKKGNSNGK